MTIWPWATGAPDFTILTLLSPSVTSSSEISDSATRSIRVLSFLKSIEVLPARLKKIPVNPDSLAEHEKIGFGDYRRNLKSFNCKFDGDPVAVGSQATDHARGEIGQVGVVPKAFPAINVRNMYLDKWDRHTG